MPAQFTTIIVTRETALLDRSDSAERCDASVACVARM